MVSFPAAGLRTITALLHLPSSLCPRGQINPKQLCWVQPCLQRPILAFAAFHWVCSSLKADALRKPRGKTSAAALPVLSRAEGLPHAPADSISAYTQVQPKVPLH